MARESATTNTGAERDVGSALVAVIGVMVVLTILVVTIASASLFNIRTTTETRANVQARAAAEAGIDYVRSKLGAAFCEQGTVISPGGSPEFTVTIHPSYEATVTATSALPAACLEPGRNPSSIVLVATGTAASSGVGSSSGNSRKVEALLKSAVSSAPVFNAAIYSGQSGDVSTKLTLTGAGADVVVDGSWLCSSEQTISGSLYATGDVTVKSSIKDGEIKKCTVDGSIYSSGKLDCPSIVSIGGNVYAQKNASFSSNCVVGGEVWVGGNVDPSHGLTVAGNLTAKGDIAVAPLPTVGGNITAGGKIAGGSGWWYEQVKAKYPTAAQNQFVGLPPSGDSIVKVDFPEVRQGDSIFSGFVSRSWTASTNSLRNPYVSMSTCNMDWGGIQFGGALTVDENTVFDTTLPGECGGKLTLGAGLTIKLNADAVIFADEFTMNGNVRVESGDGTEHSLYLITPYPVSQTACAPPYRSKIQFTSGSWTQGAKTSVLLYSAGSIGFTSSPVLRGQIYSCGFSASTPVSIAFSKTGATGATPSTAKPSLEYLRDIAN